MFPTWVQTWSCNFRTWADLMTNNYEVYTNPYSESPERECYEWFWAVINMDETFSKKSLEEFYRRLDDIDRGKVKTYPMDDVLKLWTEDAQKYYDD